MLLDGVLVPAGVLVNGVTITQAAAVESVHYFHIELERHDVLLAEGAPSESFVDDDSRGMFTTRMSGRSSTLAAHGFRPNTARRAIVDGEVLERIKRAIDLAAGIAVAGSASAPARPCRRLVGPGFARLGAEPDKPEAPVCLEVWVDGLPCPLSWPTGSAPISVQRAWAAAATLSTLNCPRGAWAVTWKCAG